MSIEAIKFYLVLLDSIGAILTSLLAGRWYTRHFRLISRFFPIGVGWAVYYFVLVLWIGSLLLRGGVL